MARFYLFLKLHFFTFVYFLEHYFIFGCFGERKLCENYIFLIQTSIWQKSNRGIVLRRKQLKLLRLLICKKKLKCLLKTDIMQFTPPPKKKKIFHFQNGFFLFSNLFHGRWPPCRSAWAGWCARTGQCSSLWCHTMEDKAQRFPSRRDPSAPSGKKTIQFVLKRNGLLKLRLNTFFY